MSGFEVKFGAEVPRPHGKDTGASRYQRIAIWWPRLVEEGAGATARLHLSNRPQRILVTTLCGGVSLLIAALVPFDADPTINNLWVAWLVFGLFSLVALASATTSIRAVIDGDGVELRTTYFWLFRRLRRMAKAELRGLRHVTEVRRLGKHNTPRLHHYLVAENHAGDGLPLCWDDSPDRVRRCIAFAKQVRLCDELERTGFMSRGDSSDGGDGGGAGGDGGGDGGDGD